MRLPRIRSGFASVAVLLLALLLGGGGVLDPALELAHNRLLSASTSNDLDHDVDVGDDALRHRRRNPDAVVVLGYALNRDGTPSDALAHRVRAAVREWERACDGVGVGVGRSSRDNVDVDAGVDVDCPVALVFSGGHPGGGVGARGNRSEAEVMRDLALKEIAGGKNSLSLPPSSWKLEAKSTSTWENAVESLRLLSLPSSRLEKQGKSNDRPFEVSIATSPFHQRRSLGAFRCAASKLSQRKNNSDVVRFAFSAAASPRPPPGTPAERAERAFEAGREVAAIAWYEMRGRLC